MRDDVLRSAKGLKGYEQWGEVFIGPDLTRKERERDYELRQEVKSRRRGGETNLLIRRGRIVQRDEVERDNGGTAEIEGM